MQRKQERLTNAVEAAKKYKRALEAERRGSLRPKTGKKQFQKPGRMGRLLTKVTLALHLVPSEKDLLNAAQRYIYADDLGGKQALDCQILLSHCLALPREWTI